MLTSWLALRAAGIWLTISLSPLKSDARLRTGRRPRAFPLFFEPDRKRPIKQRLRKRPEGEVGVRPNDPRDLPHFAGHDLGEIVVLLEPQHGDDVPVSGDRVHLHGPAPCLLSVRGLRGKLLHASPPP